MKLFNSKKHKENKEFSKSVISSSWQLVKSEKHLLWFELISFLTSVLVFSLIVLQMGYNEYSEGGGEVLELTFKNGPWSVAVILLCITAGYNVAYWCRVAYQIGIINKINGEDNSFSATIKQALKKLPRIIQYSLFTSTVGLVMGFVTGVLDQNIPFGGKIIGFFGQIAFAVASIFLIPILVIRDIGPFSAIKESSDLITKVWGKSLRGNVIVAIYYIPIFFAASYVMILGLLWLLVNSFKKLEAQSPPIEEVSFSQFLGAIEFTSFPALLVVLGLIIFFVVTVASSLLSSIYNTNVYLYAVGNKTSKEFDKELFKKAFVPKEKIFS